MDKFPALEYPAMPGYVRLKRPKPRRPGKAAKASKGRKVKAKAKKAAPAKAPAKVLKLLPVMRPAHNMREIIKQCTLLEDHHIDPKKRCPNCVSKHGKCIEGLAEEAVTLCKAKESGIAKDAAKVATTVRVLQHAWIQRPKDDTLNTVIARKLRRMRKGLQEKYSFLPMSKLPSDEAAAVRKLLLHTKNVKKVT